MCISVSETKKLCAYIAEKESLLFLSSGDDKDDDVEVENHSSKSYDVVKVWAGHAYQPAMGWKIIYTHRQRNT